MLTSLRSNALAVALSLSMPEAVGQMQLSEDGRGEVLIFPFYSAASGEETAVIRNRFNAKTDSCAGAFGAQVFP